MQPASIALPSPLIRCGFVYGFTLFLHNHNAVPFSSDNRIVATLENKLYGGNCVAVNLYNQYTPPFVDQSSQFLFYDANYLILIVFNCIFQKSVWRNLFA